jgi:predicted nucleotide-binding protein
LNDALALDKDEAWLEQHILAPRRQGRDIFIAGQVYSWDDIDEIHISQTDLPSSDLVPQIRARRRTEGIAVPIEDGWYVAYEGEEVTERFITGPPGSLDEDKLSGGMATDRKAVMVVYGHDKEANDGIFDWLRAVGLHPREWGELVRASGGASPFIGDVLNQAFRDAQAVVVLFTPDEHVVLREVLSGHPEDWKLQARPNVLFEAGMAFATHPDRTVLVVLGNHAMPSDLAGRHFVRLDGTVDALHELASRLAGAGCKVRTSGTQWLRTSRFPSRDDISALPATRGLGDRRSSMDTLLAQKLNRILQDVITSASSTLAVSPRELGAHVWQPTANGMALERVARVRVGDTPPNRPREWRRGEGVVGRCWEIGEDVYINLQGPGLNGLDEISFEQLDDNLKMGLNYADFQRVQLDFRAIWATPIYRHDELLGVLSLNVDRDRHGDFGSQLTTDIRRLLRSGASRIELALP